MPRTNNINIKGENKTMKRYKLEKRDINYNLDLEDELYSMDYTVIINGFVNYKGLNEEKTEEDFQDCDIIPLFATIHGNISFNTYKFSQWDSGKVGFIAVNEKESFTNEDLDLLLEKLDSLYNGYYYELAVIEEDICDCCDNVKDSEFIDGVFVFTEKEKKDAILYLMEEYPNIYNLNDFIDEY